MLKYSLAWRDSPSMLHLQRGKPVIYMNRADADGRGVADGDAVRVRNDIGEFELEAKVASAVREGQVIVYHAWEPFQVRGQFEWCGVAPVAVLVDGFEDDPVQVALD